MDSKARRLVSLACITMVPFLKMEMMALPWNVGKLVIVSLQSYGMLVDVAVAGWGEARSEIGPALVLIIGSG
ncbi:hypothetical protein NDU88_010775 [Pleurodeles waltl]|uniref:Uncharacterized protein n=1 Tax=Pleurodeles waltl TaxID=8319 RepID=A0AAV7S2C7_PLEWA|nr:hypothetical protein NDU88_010775 [Pleurodeles waltl]